MREIVVDTCCLINLCAASDLGSILNAIGGTWYLPAKVQDEALFLRSPEGSTADMVPVNLDAYVEQGALVTCDISGDAELELFVEFAVDVDDGEAMALAIARNRDWPVATDDRKAIRTAAAQDVRTVTTPEVMQMWQQASNIGPEEMAEALLSIERAACFSPPTSDHLHDWWAALTADEKP